MGLTNHEYAVYCALPGTVGDVRVFRVVAGSASEAESTACWHLAARCDRREVVAVRELRDRLPQQDAIDGLDLDGFAPELF